MEEQKVIDEKTMAADLKDQVFEGDVAAGELSDKELIEKYINDEKTIINSVYWADQFEQRFRGNWFSIQQVCKKTQFKKTNEALGILQVMCMVGVCHAEMHMNSMRYKITLGKEKKVLLLNKELENVKAEKDQMLQKVAFQYEMRISALEEQIKKFSPPIPVDVTTETTTAAA